MSDESINNSNITKLFVDSDKDIIWISKSIVHKMLDECLDSKCVNVSLTINLDMNMGLK